MTATATATAIELLASATPISEIVDRTGLSTGQTAALAETKGLTPEHARTALEQLLKALVWGETHDTPKVQHLAARARTALTDLVRLRASEAQAAEARAEIDDLKKKLANAEGKLKAALGKPTQALALTSPTSRAERQRIRDWARSNGHPVSDRGVISKQIMDAWNNRTSDKPGGAA